MEKDKSLRYNQKVMLALYLETFKEYYNKGTDKYNESFNTTINEGKMEYLCYIFQNMHLFDDDYGFSLNYYTPYSPGIMSLINDINNKKQEKNDFYNKYYEIRKKHYDNYDTLAEYYTYEQINKINQVISVLNNVNKEELGIESLAILHYFMNNICPGEDIDFNINKIENKYDIYKNKQDLLKEEYDFLKTLELIKTNKTRIRK